jgi:hypothetical protein
MNENNHIQKFPGFPPKPSMNFWSYPKDLNGYWHQLTGSEQKVLDYILRHTWGFDKVADEISLTQLEKGIKGFDNGTGLSRPTIVTALKGLIKKRFIDKKMGKKANRYELVKNFNYPSKKSLLLASKKSLPTINNNTIKKKQYASFKKKPYYREDEMREFNGKWWVIQNDEWLEFAGKESEIEWR